MDTFVQDVRYAVRKLLRSPGFTFIALTTLALAIGATTAIFSVVDGVLLRPLPFRNPERIVRVGESGRDGRPFPLSALDYIDYRDGAKSFDAMAPYTRDNANLTGGGAQPLRLSVARVGDRYFDLLGVGAQVGRTFVGQEGREGTEPTVVISDELWRSHFGADPRIVGQTLSLDGTPYTVIGVAPPSLRFPSGSDLYTAYQWQPYEMDPENRGAHGFFAVGRLKKGVSIATAKAELQGIAAHLEKAFPESNTGFGASVEDMREQMVGNVKPALYAMLGAVAFVLLIACANVANLLLVRAAARESEIAVRTALGAGRGRILRQLVTESLLLSAGGAALGLALAAWAVAAVVAFGPEGLPRLGEVAIDGRVLAFALTISVFTGVLFGLVPAFHAARPDIAQMLRESVRGSSKGGMQRTRSALVVAEMTLAVVLLVGAGLLIHSFVRLINVDPGFNPERVIAFNLSLPQTKYQFERDIRGVVSNLTDRLRQLPGTRDVGVTFGRPLDNSGLIRTSFEVEGWAPSTPGNRRVSQVHMTSPGYFTAMGIPLLRGRLFTTAEDRLGVPPVVVVTQEFARKYFPNDDPIGKRVTFGITHDTAETGKGSAQVGGEIVGIVGDVKDRDLATPAYPTAYAPFNTYAIGFFSVLIRTDASSATVAAAIKRTVREVDADLPIYGLTTMEQAVSNSVAQPRFYMMLLGAFAAIALLLAALGIYGVISYTVSQRTRELGIRVALGATRDAIVRLVVAQGIWMAGFGVVLGVLASTALTRAISSLLFGIEKLDPLTLAVAPVTLMTVALLGCYIPARRAARVDPVIAMRND